MSEIPQVPQPPEPDKPKPVNGYVLINSEGKYMTREGFWSPYGENDHETSDGRPISPWVHTSSNLDDIAIKVNGWGNLSIPPEKAYKAIFDPNTGKVVIDKESVLSPEEIKAVIRKEASEKKKKGSKSA